MRSWFLMLAAAATVLAIAPLVVHAQTAPIAVPGTNGPLVLPNAPGTVTYQSSGGTTVESGVTVFHGTGPTTTIIFSGSGGGSR